MTKDPFIKVMFEQTGVETAVRQSYYDRYPQNMRHLGLYEDQGKEVEVKEVKPKEPTRADLMNLATVKGLTFSTSVTKAELTEMLKE